VENVGVEPTTSRMQI